MNLQVDPEKYEYFDGGGCLCGDSNALGLQSLNMTPGTSDFGARWLRV